MTDKDTFAGFTPQAMQFLYDLKINNNHGQIAAADRT